MNNLVLNILFPKRCIGCKKFGSYICPSCFSSISFEPIPICPICNKQSIDGTTHPFCKTKYCIDGLTCGVVYKGIVKKLIYQFKYKPYVSTLSKSIDKLFYESLVQNEVFFNLLKFQPIITPVPLYKSKEKKRGYNHATIIAKNVADNFFLEFIDNVLIRVRDTNPQYTLNKNERIKNIKDAFLINNRFKEKIKGKQILLIDDVATTCTTLNECAKVLKKNGVKFVWSVTFAREI